MVATKVMPAKRPLRERLRKWRQSSICIDAEVTVANLTISQAARACGVASTTLPQAIRRGRLALYGLGMALAGGLLVLLLVGPSGAEPYEDGVRAMERGDYAKAARKYRQAGDQGNANAQFRLGVIYFIGQGVP
jgi:TPR repeat protein